MVSEACWWWDGDADGSVRAGGWKGEPDIRRGQTAGQRVAGVLSVACLQSFLFLLSHTIRTALADIRCARQLSSVYHCLLNTPSDGSVPQHDSLDAMSERAFKILTTA